MQWLHRYRTHRQECLCYVGFHRQECLCHIGSLPLGRASTSGRAGAVPEKSFAFRTFSGRDRRLDPTSTAAFLSLSHFSFFLLPFFISSDLSPFPKLKHV